MSFIRILSCRAMPLLVGAGVAVHAFAGGEVVINEIHYAPPDPTIAEEFVELHNPTATEVDLTGWRITGGIGFDFPAGSKIAGNGYLVVAQDPVTMQTRYRTAALGPWTGRLANDGDRITLRDAATRVVNEVEYQLGFPWPTVGELPGYSIELLNPAFDNSLGGNWRASTTDTSGPQSQVLLPAGSAWKHFKGTSEPSATPGEWRAMNFDDAAWNIGLTPIGYDPALPMRTPLPDMAGGYSTVYFRSAFIVEDPAAVSALTLTAQYDDGFCVWINGVNVLNANMPVGGGPYTMLSSSTRENGDYVDFALPQPGSFLVAGPNVIAVQLANTLLSGSSDCFLDLKLTSSKGPTGKGPTPGAQNCVWATNAPPQIRQVEHHPRTPHSGEPVRITAKISDPEGVTSATLQYQVVEPGQYIELTDAAYETSWTTVPMNDDGTNGDAMADDSEFTVELPAALSQHRRLIRYRITATDGHGEPVTVPYPDDPQPNFACFVYDGVPAWQGAVRTNSTPVMTFDTNVMRRLPAIHLLAKNSAVRDATWISKYGGDLYLWQGALVFNGKVYDHVRYRMRGGVWRYAMVKNMWKFDFNRGHDFQMIDDYGKNHSTRWTKLNLGACIQQGDYGHRGEQGMFESVGFRLMNLAGVAAPHTTFVQFRIVDDAPETDPTTQYEGDFWGLYLALEQPDGRFLDEHDLPDGNLYKMEGGTGDPNNLGPAGPIDRSDLNAFISGYQQNPPDTWWLANLNLQGYYSYRTLVEGIHHYDIDDPPGKNYFFFRDPVTQRWSVHPWDLDLTWADNMYGGGVEPFKNRVLPLPSLNISFRNRMREIRDLLFNANQAGQLIDEHAWRLRGTDNSTFLDADRAMWDYNPKMADASLSSSIGKAGRGLFYRWPNESAVTKDFNGCLQLMKNYVSRRGSLLDNLSRDTAIPALPTITYAGPAGFPLNRLRFSASAYSGSAPFAAMKWRLAEITDTNSPAFDPDKPWHYEMETDWESPELSEFTPEISPPAGVVKAGHTYRARVRMLDNTGRWSRWSLPLEFVAGAPDTATDLLEHLRLTELMGQPAGGSQFEFVELRNTSAEKSLDLGGATFTTGIDFAFPAGTRLAPGAYLLVVRATNENNFAAFRARYKLDASVPVFGPYSSSLDNGGEPLTLRAGAGGAAIVDFEYHDARGWPLAPFGAGHSLVPLDRTLADQGTGALDYPGNWRASTFIDGSPGRADPAPPLTGVTLNEIVAHTDYSDPVHPEYDSNDWIELLNAGDSTVTLTNWFLSDDPEDLRKWTIPVRQLSAGERVSYDEVTGFHRPITSGFGLNKAGEQVLLSLLPANGQERVVDSVRFKGQPNDVSLARHPEGGDFWRATAPTRNGANASPIASLVISEFMYHPPDTAGIGDNPADEYLELFNPTAQPIALFDTNGTWRIDGGVEFTFPTNVVVPAGSFLLLVQFAPGDAVAKAAFENVYGQLPPTTQVFGPLSGHLGNRSERIAIERPQYPDMDTPGDQYSWIIVDEVIYGNQTPWPALANGSGLALQRVASARSGNDPENFIAASPTPGTEAALDTDGDGLPDNWETAAGLSTTDPADADADLDHDDMSNRQEFLAGTDPRDPASRLELTATIDPGYAVRLNFTTTPRHSYSVLYRDSLDGHRWEPLLDVDATAAGESIVFPDPLPPAQQRYYRLQTPKLP